MHARNSIYIQVHLTMTAKPAMKNGLLSILKSTIFILVICFEEGLMNNMRKSCIAAIDIFEHDQFSLNCMLLNLTHDIYLKQIVSDSTHLNQTL